MSNSGFHFLLKTGEKKTPKQTEKNNKQPNKKKNIRQADNWAAQFSLLSSELLQWL